MNGVQLYTIVHFGEDIVRPKIGSIVTYVGGSTKLTSLRTHSSYEDFVTLFEEINEIHREDCKGLSTTKDTGSGRGLFTTKVGGSLRYNSFPNPEPECRGYPETNSKGLDRHRFEPFVDDENDSFETICTDVPPSNEPSIPQSNVHLSNEPVLTNVPQSNEHFQTIPTNVPLSNEPSISQSSIYLSNEPVLTNAEFRFEPQPEHVKDLLDFRFKFPAYTEDPYDSSKEFNIGDLYRDRIELKNHIRAYVVVNKFNLEHVLSNEYKIVLVRSAIFRVSTYRSMHTCIRVEIEGGNAYKAASGRWVASIIKQKLRKDLNYKSFRIIDNIQIHHNIDVTYNLDWRAKEKAHAKTQRPLKVGHTYWRCLGLIFMVMTLDSSSSLTGTPKLLILYPRMAVEALTCIDFDKHMNAIWNTDPVGLQYILGIPKETWSNLYIPMSRYGVAYTNHVESWNNDILKVRDLPIHVFIEELRRIYSEMSYTYREEEEKSQARLTSWATDYCESRKFITDSLICRVRRSRHHFQMTSYGRTDFVNIEDGTCSCCWWQTIGIPCEHGVRVLSLANVDPTTRVSEYCTNNTYKVVYKPIWIPIRGIEQ
ncbi:hypothetical protein GIB67_007390 [Kingdonia uniflora]|uniref:SWIM-type domain-containing protein n=1 Tax=Kingdonia uniflora TaxID=39325 RepID=A0A7J7MLH4_9MAGN|nr:hypothetical protein GIB67_007390 [Kingdonia uniflora]